MDQSTYDTLLGALLIALLGAVGYAIRRQITAGESNRKAIADQARDFTAALAQLSATFADQMQKVTISLTELNTGASAGARAAIADLREELRFSFREVNKDVSQLRTEHDNLAERHANTNSTVVQLAERVNFTRDLVHEMRREPRRPERPPSGEPT